MFGLETLAALGTLAAGGLICWRCVRGVRLAAENWRQLVEGNETGFMVVQGGRVVFANGACRRVLHLAPDAPLEGLTPLAQSACDECRRAGTTLAGLSADEAQSFVYRCEQCVATRLLEELEYRTRPLTWNGRPALQITVQCVSDRALDPEGLRHGEKLLQTVIDAIPHRVYLKSLDGRYLFVNKAKAAFYGCAPAEMIGKDIYDFNTRSEAYRERVKARDAEVLARGETVEFPKVVITYADGRTRLQRISKSPIYSEAGRVCAILGVAEDITERTHAEEELRRNQRLLRAVVDSAPYSMSVKDEHGTYVIANRAMARIYDLPPEEVVGKRVDDFSGRTPEVLKRAKATDRAVIETGRTVRLDQEPIVTADGVLLIRNLVKVPLFDDEKRVNGVLCIGEDITERTRVEAALGAERRLLKTIFDTLPLRIYVKDLNLRYVIVNRAMASYHGMEPEEVIGKGLEDLADITPQHLAGARRRDHEVLTNGALLRVPELRVTRGDGSEDVFRTVKVPLLDEHHAIVGLVGFAEDITEMVHTRDRLRSQGELLKSVMEAYVRQSERYPADG